MSKELPNSNRPEEFDLVFIFSVLEKVFNKIGRFFIKTFSILSFFIGKVFVFLLFIINLIRRNTLVVILTSVVGFGVLYYLNKPKTIIYSSNMLLKQNFETGKVLYRNISLFNSLASKRDSVALANELDISENVAAGITGFSIAHNANKNQLRKDYFEFQKQTDSTSRITYDDYILFKDLENFPLQTIFVTSEDPLIYRGLSESIMTSVLNNNYFENLKNSEIESINRKKQLLIQLISESDTLQSNYFSLLKGYYGVKEQKNDKNINPTINLNLDSQKDKISTKEYELFEQSKSLKIQINDIEDELKKKNEIFVKQKDFSTPFIVENDFIGVVLFATFLLVLFVLLILIIRELGLIEQLNKYGTKEKLFKRYVKK